MTVRSILKRPEFLTKPALVNIFILANSLVWYALAINILEISVTALNVDSIVNALIWGSHFCAIIFSAIGGAFLTKRLGGRVRFLTIWLIIGAITPFVSLFFSGSSLLNVILLSLIFGVAFGFGMPNYMGYFVDQTAIENRGKIGGLMVLLTGLGSAGLGQFINIDNFILQIIILSVWRGLGLAVFILFKSSKPIEEINKSTSYRKLLTQRTFIFYLIPWFMFSLLNYLTTPVQVNVLEKSVIYNLDVIGNVFMGAFAVLGGFLMDSMGRKRMAIIGFVMLGLSYSMIGIFQDTSVWYLHTIINGISWGILYVLFVVIIWGDLSNGAPSDKYYALGVTPFFISKFVELTITSQIVSAIPLTAIFSFTAFFLFLAVLPLIYAPETLPEKHIKDRELKNYLEKANKVKQKYS